MFEYLSKLTQFIPPELSHRLFIYFLKLELIRKEIDDEVLRINLWNKNFKNPLGLAAGFDKNAEVISGSLNLGFGFVEVGTVTYKPQYGNEKPRVFRIPEYNSVIQRLGFNNKGIEVFIKNIERYRERNQSGIVGSNIGKNKDSGDYTQDYLDLLKRCHKKSDYITINISSPNTPGLRDIQKKDKLNNLLKKLYDENHAKTPLLLKISPDISMSDLENICDISLNKEWLNGLIISNTTISRDSITHKQLRDPWKVHEKGGLSGPPLLDKSNQLLERTYKLTKGKVPIIGVGGISSANDAFNKIALGASLLQIYTVLIYSGPMIVIKILEGLKYLLLKNGFKNIQNAIGHKVK